MPARVHRASLIATFMAMGVVAGCGASSIVSTRSSRAGRRALAVAAAPSGAVRVIRAWSDALRHGDVRAAARYFALPSVMVNGTDATGQALVITIANRAQAEAANASLPCGARLISADRRGRYVNALFRLTGRPGPGGTDCGGGVGQTARTNFVIAHGLIVQWIRAPDDPGDNPGAPAPVPTPSAPQTTGPSV